MRPAFLRVLLVVAVSVTALLSQGRRSHSPLPAPTGPYAVGRTHFIWTDETRPDPESPTGHREIVVWLWYPSNPNAAAERSQQLPGKWRELFWSNFRTAQLRATGKDPGVELPEVLTHSGDHSAMAFGDQRFPVLLFGPGLGYVPLVYASLLEELASHGYIVAGIVPTYYTGVSILSEGRIAGSHLRPPPEPGNPPDPGPPPQSLYFPLWTGDMRFTLNQLEKLNADTTRGFNRRLDLRGVGAFGHSFGGAASLQAAKDDSRIKAAMDIDGRLWGDVLSTGLSKPFLIFRSDLEERNKIPPPPDKELMKRVDDELDSLLRIGGPGYRLVLARSTHMFASDLGFMPVLKDSIRPNMGSNTPERALDITRVYVKAFFDQYLKTKKSRLMKGPSSDYPEIKFEFGRGK